MNSVENVENTLYSPLYSKQNCQIFEGVSIGISVAIVIDVFIFIYIMFTSKHLGNSIGLIFTIISLIASNVCIYYICRVLRGMCLKSLN